MHVPHMTQGKPRALPDGFLHLNNFSHIRQSGLAGCIFERVFTERQQEIVGCALLEIANGDESKVHFKHNVWRFKKEFLVEHFAAVVYGACRLIRRSAGEMMAIAITSEELMTEKRNVKYPALDKL